MFPRDCRTALEVNRFESSSHDYFVITGRVIHGVAWVIVVYSSSRMELTAQVGADDCVGVQRRAARILCH